MLYIRSHIATEEPVTEKNLVYRGLQISEHTVTKRPCTALHFPKYMLPGHINGKEHNILNITVGK